MIRFRSSQGKDKKKLKKERKKKERKKDRKKERKKERKKGRKKEKKNQNQKRNMHLIFSINSVDVSGNNGNKLMEKFSILRYLSTRNTRLIHALRAYNI